MEQPTATKAQAPFVVMAKPVGSRCNMKCDYCYYLATEYPQASDLLMSADTLEHLIRQYIEASPGPVVSFTWHGGEPTLAGLDFFRTAVALQKKYLPAGWSCWNSLQTNGLLLDDAWCAFLAAEHFDVGLSIDGTAPIHDTHRRDLGGSATHDRTAGAIALLKKHGVRPDLLCTVNAATLQDPVGVYRALRRYDTGWIQFIPIVATDAHGNPTPQSVSAQGYGAFLCAVFDQWSCYDLGQLDVQLFAEMAQVLSGGAPSLCWMAPTCGRAVIAEHDGGIYACDHFVDTAHCLGNIATAHLGTLVDAPAQIHFGNAKRDTLPQTCRDCRWLAFCHGGCPKDRLPGTGINTLCAGLQAFFAHSAEPLRHIVQQRRQKIPYPQIMADMRTRAQAKWKNIGRNDLCPCGSSKKAKNCCWSFKP